MSIPQRPVEVTLTNPDGTMIGKGMVTPGPNGLPHFAILESEGPLLFETDFGGPYYKRISYGMIEAYKPGSVTLPQIHYGEAGAILAANDMTNQGVPKHPTDPPVIDQPPDLEPTTSLSADLAALQRLQRQ